MGTAQINITPSEPILMSGYSGRKTPFTGIHDSLYAIALFFIRKKIQNLIISADLSGFSSE